VSFCSYTGKAARVLKERLKKSKAIYKQDSISTIHSLIYSPITNKKDEIIGWKKKDELKTDLIIIDEASMVNYEIWDDLTSFGKRIVAVGDHGQLPPIHGSFNLMEKPDIKLEKIHRQAKDNPIINLSILARENGHIPIREYSPHVKKLNQTDPSNAEVVNSKLAKYDKDTMILCGYNFTRVELNNFVREQIGHDGVTPIPGDRVICLRNNYNKEIFNGMTGTIKSISPESPNFYFAEIDMDGEDKLYSGLIHREQFNRKKTLEADDEMPKELLMKGDLFDFGYAFTVHKAQGSQAKKVILFEQRFKKMNDDQWRRWLYTGVTRAREELIIIGKSGNV
jgi:exodeoxyribonuclease-5